MAATTLAPSLRRAGHLLKPTWSLALIDRFAAESKAVGNPLAVVAEEASHHNSPDTKRYLEGRQATTSSFEREKQSFHPFKSLSTSLDQFHSGLPLISRELSTGRFPSTGSRHAPVGHVSATVRLSLFGQAQPSRGMFIQTQPTPNPSSLMFLPGSPVLPEGTAEYTSARAALASPLAISLFRIDGVSRVFLGSDFITVTKTDDSSWDVLKPEAFAAIMDFYSSGKPVVDPNVASDSADSSEGDSEIVEMIKELLETRIRPAVQEDGGDIDFHNFDEETGVVTLRMRGACSGCPSSAVTLKSGVESMLMHYIPEVTSVEQVMEDEVDGEASTTSSA